MNIDRDQYWHNRKSGRRGQGINLTTRLIDPSDSEYDREHFVVGSNMRRGPFGIVFLNREDARKRQVDRTGSNLIGESVGSLAGWGVWNNQNMI